MRLSWILVCLTLSSAGALAQHDCGGRSDLAPQPELGSQMGQGDARAGTSQAGTPGPDAEPSAWILIEGLDMDPTVVPPGLSEPPVDDGRTGWEGLLPPLPALGPSGVCLALPKPAAAGGPAAEGEEPWDPFFLGLMFKLYALQHGGRRPFDLLTAPRAGAPDVDSRYTDPSRW